MSALRIAVGFKVTPDYEALRPADWARGGADPAPGATSLTRPGMTRAPRRARRALRAGGDAARARRDDVPGPDVRFVRRILGVFDEAALELALRLRDARTERGLMTHLAAFSIAGREADPFLATLQALGYDRVCRVDAAWSLDFAPAATARLVAACATRLGGDVLLLGAQSGPGDSGLVPFLAAEGLGRPCLTQVTDIEPADDVALRVTWTAGRSRLRARVAPPCVLGIGNASVSMLRVPTLKDRLAARAETAEVATPDDLGVDMTVALAREPVALVDLAVVERRRSGRVVTGASPQAKARALFETELRPRLERRRP